MWHTKGTSLIFSEIISNCVPGVCLMCAYNVPDVCKYFFDKYILKNGIKAFQRRVARIFTTKTRFCGSN
jgi:hypothetical protein